MRKFWAIVGVLVALFGYYAYAQVNTTGNVVATGVAPTQNTDNSALTDLTSIRIYRKVGSGAYSVTTSIPFTAVGGVFTYNDNGLANGTYCYQATALNAQGNESMASNEACRTVLVLFPKAPTNVQVN